MGQPEDPLLAGVSDPLCTMGQPEDPLLAGVSDPLCAMGHLTFGSDFC